jgi:hypothetical protein
LAVHHEEASRCAKGSEDKGEQDRHGFGHVAFLVAETMPPPARCLCRLI